jgi:hypothetical protein
MLFWPLISKALKLLIPRKRDKLAEQQPVE